MKAYSDRKARRKELADELLKLATTWYEQVRKLNEMLEFKDADDEIDRAHATYLSTREVLPKYVRVTEELVRYRKCKSLLIVARSFLLELTMNQNAEDDCLNDILMDIPLYRKRHGGLILIPPEPDGCRTPDRERLPRLDRYIQKMARIAASL